MPSRPPRALLVCATLFALTTAASAQDVRREDVPAEKPKPPQLTSPPQLLEGAEPTYPPEAAEKGLEADVIVRITIDATGAVTNVVVPTPVGNGFDEAAVEAARRYRFKPAEWDGKPGPITVETTIHFKMQVVEAEPPPDETDPTTDAPKGTSVIEGVVKERGTRKKLEGVTVAVRELGLAAPDSDAARVKGFAFAETITDAAGRFRVEGLPAGKYQIVAILSGYDRYEERLDLAADEKADTTLYLRAKGGTPYETVVEGETEKLEVTKHTLDRRQLTTVPGTFGDPLRVLASLPGMARSPFSTGILLIRGSNPDDSGVYIDGVRVPLLYHFLGGPSILNPEFLEDIDLYPGGFPVRFGRSLGGVIDVNTRPTKSDGFHGAADVDLIDSSVYLRFPASDDVGIAVATRRSYIDLLLPFFLPEPDPGDQLVVVPVYYDYQARMDWRISATDSLSVLFFGSDDRLDVLSVDAEDEQTFDLGTHIGFNRLRATYTTRLSPEWTMSITPLAGIDVVSLSAGERTATSITDTTFGVRERVVGKLGDRLRFDFGTDLLYRITDYELTLPIASDVAGFGGEVEDLQVEPEDFSRSSDSYALGLYAEMAWDIGAGVRVIPGLRLDLHLLSGEQRVSLDPRLIARWQITRDTALKGYVGLFTQPPQPEGFDSRFGNPDLELEQAIQTGLGFEQRIGRYLTIDSEIYYITRDDLAVFSGDVRMRDDGTLDPLFWSNEAEGRTYGLELIIKREITRNFFGWVSYTLSRSESKRREEQELAPATFDQTHNFIGVASYRTDGGWEFGARLQVTTGRPRTPINGSTYLVDEDRYDAFNGPRNSEREETFAQLDVRIDKTWVFNTWMIGVYLDIINVLNMGNREATQWDYRFRDSAPVRGVPLVPTLGVKGQW